MNEIDKSKPVMITGATGYVAGWIVKKLLDSGFTVHAAVRDPNNVEKLKYLNAIAENANGTLKYFRTDLLDPGSYDEAMKDCELVFHTASPFTLKIKDAKKDLVDPALKGTRNVLESVNRIKSVKRVVLTSSCAAIYGDNADIQDMPGKTLTEEMWNTTSTPEHQPYSYSKTVAEKEAWKIHDAQDRWNLVVINPSLVLGPGINPFGTSESFNIIKQMGDGSFKTGVPDYAIGTVDIRDVAEAHIKAAFTPTAVGRYITSGRDSGFLELAQILRQKFGDAYPFPRKTLPKFLVMLLGPLSGLKRKMLKRNLGYPFRADNSKIKKDLGIKFRPLEESLTDFFRQMIDHNIVKPKK
jgi:nucleoside-diphosphate-sugar epimerase